MTRTAAERDLMRGLDVDELRQWVVPLATSPWTYAGILATLMAASPQTSTLIGRNLGLGVGMTAQGIVHGLSDGLSPEWLDETAARTRDGFREHGLFGVGGRRGVAGSWRDFRAGAVQLVRGRD